VPHDPEVDKLVREALGRALPSPDWVDRLLPLSVEQLARVAAGLQGGGILAGREAHALEALRTVVDAKLAAQTHDLMKKLDAATSGLQRVGIIVGVVGVLVMLLQLLLAWLVAHATGAV
jgi:hypothetical protein